MILFRRAALLIAVMLAGFAVSSAWPKDSATQTRPASPGKAHIYIYREASIYGSGNSFDLYANDHLIAA
jgi:hypothetical protein